MRLLSFDDFSVVLRYDHANSTWEVQHVFRRIPGRIEAETVTVGHLPWSHRIYIAELVNDNNP